MRNKTILYTQLNKKLEKVLDRNKETILLCDIRKEDKEMCSYGLNLESRGGRKFRKFNCIVKMGKFYDM